MPTRPDFTIVFLGQEVYDKDRVSWTKYRYTADFPAQLVTVFDTVWPLPRRINKKVSDFGITFISKQGRSSRRFTAVGAVACRHSGLSSNQTRFPRAGSILRLLRLLLIDNISLTSPKLRCNFRR